MDIGYFYNMFTCESVFLNIMSVFPGGCWTRVGGQARVREGVLGGEYIYQQAIWSISVLECQNYTTSCLSLSFYVISEVEDGGCSSSTWTEG